MAPAPLCKTAIVSFLIDEETLPKLWNLSSNMRKRLQMILEQMEIILGKYNEKVLKVKEWVRIGRECKSVKSTSQIKKGVSNYELNNQEQLDKVLSLNGKLRFHNLQFQPGEFLQIDCIEYLAVNSNNYDFWSSCFFKRIGDLYLHCLSSTQIKHLITRFSRTKTLTIESGSISDLDLKWLNVTNLQFYHVTFSGELKLPFYLDYLQVNLCENFDLIKFYKIRQICLNTSILKNLPDLFKSLKGLKKINIDGKVSECVSYLPNTVRILDPWIRFDPENVDLSLVKKKVPYLIKICESMPIEAAQTLNLRSIWPIMSETEEKFTLRPRKIQIDRWNAEELNKHPELFEKVEKVGIDSNKFDYNCLPGQIKDVYFYSFLTEGEKFQTLKKNSWKFEQSVINISRMEEDEVIKVLDSLKKVRKVKIDASRKNLIGKYPRFKFVIE